MSGRRIGMVATAVIVAAMLVAGAGANSQAQTAGPTYKQVGKWGKLGTGNGQFRAVLGLATDNAGRVYVADSDNSRIQVFSASGAFQDKISLGEGVFVPDVAVDADGNVLGTTDTATEVRWFTRDGRSLGSVTTPRSTRGIGADAEGNFYVAMGSDNDYRVVRYDKSGGNYTEGLTLRGFRSPYDVEVSRDGTVWVSDSQALNIKRFDANGKLLRTMKAGTSSQIGIGLDPDCNLWMNDIAQRRIAKYSPSGRLLATAAAPDLIAQDVVVGPKGDVYTYDVGTHTVIRFAEDKSKPATANVPGTVTARGGTAKITYTLSGVACPSVVNATATLTGPGSRARLPASSSRPGRGTRSR